MKKMIWSVFFILILAGILAFSYFAYQVREDRISKSLASINEAQQNNINQLKRIIQKNNSKYEQERERHYSTLLILFPGEENKNRIDALFLTEDADEDIADTIDPMTAETE